MTHVMVDLETWGTKPGCAIRSIGAVVFFPGGGGLHETFYANIDDRSCLDAGLVYDPRTAAWWRDQGEEAQAALLIDQRPLHQVLADFTDWFREVDGQQVWGHGASFDPVLLEAAYDAVERQVPWKFWDVRCSRTLLALGDISPSQYRRDDEVHHNALDDAKAQARAVQAVFKQFDCPGV